MASCVDTGRQINNSGDTKRLFVLFICAHVCVFNLLRLIRDDCTLFGLVEGMVYRVQSVWPSVVVCACCAFIYLFLNNMQPCTSYGTETKCHPRHNRHFTIPCQDPLVYSGHVLKASLPSYEGRLK